MTTTPTTVGRFTYDNGVISGPADYVKSDDFKQCVASIEAGTNVVFNSGAAGLSPTVEIALLVAIQTNYAGWAGMQDFNRRRGV